VPVVAVGFADTARCCCCGKIVGVVVVVVMVRVRLCGRWRGGGLGDAGGAVPRLVWLDRYERLED
jgi:hypothetical protein